MVGTGAFLGCDPEDPGRAPDDPFTIDLRDVPVSLQLAGALEASIAALEATQPSNRVTEDLARYDLLVLRLQRPSEREAVADAIYALWRADPENVLWFDLAFWEQPYLQRGSALQAMLARPVLNDTTTAIGAYARGLQVDSWSECRQAMVRVRKWPASVPPLLPTWAAFMEAWVAGQIGADDEAVEILLAQLPQMRALGGPRLEMMGWWRLAKALVGLRRLDDALHAAVMAQRCARAVESPYRVLQYSTTIADVLGRRSENDAALSILEHCMERAEVLDFPRRRADSAENIAEILSAEGRHAEAVTYQHRVLDHLTAVGDSTNAPRTMISIANQLRLLGELDLAGYGKIGPSAGSTSIPIPPIARCCPSS